MQSAIITAYVQMLDQESHENENDSSDTIPAVGSIHTNLGSSSEDDIHSKRRASPTELEPNSIEMTDIDMDDEHDHSRSGANLVKRPSFKKMRSSALESISLPAKQGSATRQGSGSSRHGSPKKNQAAK